jgi:hypothetical protein
MRAAISVRRSIRLVGLTRNGLINGGSTALL